jgi:deoxyadenosine/deoxycytidine kinase
MHIAISGNIGAGKTTLAKMLAEHYGWDVEFEAVENNPYLADFYGNMQKWAFHLQIYFLNSRFEQALKIASLQEKTIVQDRSIYEDAFIFAQNLSETGLLSTIDFSTYKSLFDTITKTIQAPDLMIYLKAELPKLQKQIALRNRDFEQSIDPAYLQQLNVLYEEFVEKYHYGLILEIDVNQLDFKNNPSDFEFIIKQIEESVNIRPQLKI